MTPAGRVVLTGSPHFASMLTDMLRAHGWRAYYVEPPGRHPTRWLRALWPIITADTIYLCSGQVERWSRPWLMKRFLNKKLVQHWVGSDTMYAQAVGARGALSRLLQERSIHWSLAPWLSAEVAALGIDAKIVPFPLPSLPEHTLPLPPEFVVLTYLPARRLDFYGREAIVRLARDLPHLPFWVVGTDHVPEAPANVKPLGWIGDMEPIYRQTSILVRFPEHDGLPRMVLEAMAYGRPVVWNYELPCVTVARTYDEMRAVVEELYAKHQRGELAVNEEGASYVWREFSPEGTLKQFMDELAGVMAS